MYPAPFPQKEVARAVGGLPRPAPQLYSVYPQPVVLPQLSHL